MKFPDYIPAIVRRQAISYLAGDGQYNKGWVALLADYEHSLKTAKKAVLEYSKILKEYDDKHIEHKLLKLRLEQANIEKNYQVMKRDAECINRLIHDRRMESVYKQLPLLFNNDANKMDMFIHTAWSCFPNAECEETAEEKAMTKALVKDIAETTDVLIQLLHKLTATGVALPAEFFHIPTLLAATSNPDNRAWNDVSPTLLGNVSKIDSEQHDVDNKRRKAIRFAWSIAPRLENILNTVSSAAESFNVQFEEHIEGMLSLNVHDIRRLYLQAFMDKMTEMNLYIPEDCYSIIAVTAAVVLNKEGLVVLPHEIKGYIAKERA